MLDLHDSRTGVTYRWNESHGVSVLLSTGAEIDYFSFGYNENGTRPTFVEFCAAVEGRIKDYE